MQVPVRIAVDALGGDHGSAVVVDGVMLALAADPLLSVLLVGPPSDLRDLLAGLAAAGRPVPQERIEVVEALEGVPMGADPVTAVRARRGTSVRVAAELVQRGRADAFLSAGQTAAALAAATFVLGRLRGITRPALAVVLPALAGPVVLLDAGAGTGMTADLLAQHALAGACYAEALGIDSPRVGLLTVGGEAGKGDLTRREAHELLGALPLRYVGPVEGHDLTSGRRADVVVTDGFTGNVALKALEGAVAWTAHHLGERYGDHGPANALIADTSHSEFAAGMLVGVAGVSVVAHGSADAGAIAAAAALAALAVRTRLVDRTGTRLAELVAARRHEMGLRV